MHGWGVPFAVMCAVHTDTYIIAETHHTYLPSYDQCCGGSFVFRGEGRSNMAEENALLDPETRLIHSGNIKTHTLQRENKKVCTERVGQG